MATRERLNYTRLELPASGCINPSGRYSENSLQETRIPCSEGDAILPEVQMTPLVPTFLHRESRQSHRRATQI
ncbi:hypothetical protein ILYODFUR_038774 [Ilyodon furcidens]|uniref:Uncharacterized protein n=1 Tax=Ilyodon furcidens TaxID=33524 RepID=A0ABV0U434_9TELE